MTAVEKTATHHYGLNIVIYQPNSLGVLRLLLLWNGRTRRSVNHRARSATFPLGTPLRETCSGVGDGTDRHQQ